MIVAIIILVGLAIIGSTILIINYMDNVHELRKLEIEASIKEYKETIPLEIERERTKQKELELERTKIQYSK